MHTVALLAHAVDVARRLGYVVRQEWIEGDGGGSCELRGRKLLFLNLALPPSEQLDVVLGVLRREAAVDALAMSHELRAALRQRKIA